MPDSPSPAPHVLIIRRRYLGDIVVLGSLIRNLRLHWPKARLTLLCDRAYAEAAALHPDLDLVRHFPPGARQWPAFLRQLRRDRYTHVLDIDNRDKTALFTLVTGAPVRLTLHRDHPKFPLRHGWVYTERIPITREWHDSHHITEIYHQILRPLGVPMRVHDSRLRLRDDELAAMRRLVGGGDRRLPKVVVHPGSRSRYRVWPADRFAAVCDRLQDDLGAQVFLVGGPGERPIVEAIRRHAATHLVAIDRSLSVSELAALFAQFDVLLAHDSGPMHVAAAAGTRVVALYGSQNATIWRPAGEGHVVLQTALPCPCFPPGVLPEPCRKEDSYFSFCVRHIDPETVFDAVASTLRDRQPPET